MVSGLVVGRRLASATPANPCARKLNGFARKARCLRHKTVSLLQLDGLTTRESGYHAAPPTALFPRQHFGGRCLPRASHRFTIGEPFGGLGRERRSEPIAQSRRKPVEVRAV